LRGTVASLQMCDTRELVIRLEGLRTKMDLESKTKAEKFLETAEGLRDRLIQVDLIEGMTWQDVVTIVQVAETLVEKSDQTLRVEFAQGFVSSVCR
jgi:hypothetical protein